MFGFELYLSASDFARRMTDRFGLSPRLSALTNSEVRALIPLLKRTVICNEVDYGFVAISTRRRYDFQGLLEGLVVSWICSKGVVTRPANRQSQRLKLLYTVLDKFEDNGFRPTVTDADEPVRQVFRQCHGVISEHNVRDHDAAFIAVGILGVGQELWLTPGFPECCESRKAKARFIRSLLQTLPQTDVIERATVAVE